MKIAIFTISMLFFLPEFVFSQTDAQNLSKYWYYRYKLGINF
jgi:hypothetical protein